MSWVLEVPIGELRPWPSSIRVVRDGTPHEVLNYVSPTGCDVDASGLVTRVQLDDVWYVPERTCKDKGNIERFICSECGCRLDLQGQEWEPTMWRDGEAMVPSFCPNCGARVEVEQCQ